MTWEWGAARGSRTSLLYGGVYSGAGASSPFFLTLVDSLGVRQVLRFDSIDYDGKQPVAGMPGVSAPRRLSLLAARLADTVRLDVSIGDALHASEAGVGGTRGSFLQMRGRFQVRGRVEGEEVADSGSGFFETYVK